MPLGLATVHLKYHHSSIGELDGLIGQDSYISSPPQLLLADHRAVKLGTGRIYQAHVLSGDVFENNDLVHFYTEAVLSHDRVIVM